MIQPSSAAVVGGGIGGLAAAIALLQAGWDVRVYEQAGRPSTVGAGIQLAPNCTRILHSLGVLAEVGRVAVRPTTFEFRRWNDGRLLSATPLGDDVERSYGAPYLHAHRADLMAVLAAAVPADRLEVGRRCVGVANDGRPAKICFADGSWEAADLVVGADGIHSVVRHALFGDERPRFTGHVAYRGLVPAERAPELSPDHRCTVRLGPARTSCTTSSPQAATSTSSALRRRAPGPASHGPTTVKSLSSSRPLLAGTRS